METQTTNGSGKPVDKRRKRTAASIKLQIATAARNRAAALKAGKGYGHSLPPGESRKPRLAPPRTARTARGDRVRDALTYSRLAQRKALRAYSEGEGGDTLGELIGLLSLSIAALEGRD